MTNPQNPTALVTGASEGLGLALATALVERDWRVVIDARTEANLVRAADALGDLATAVPGDVTDPGHRSALAHVARETGRVDLLVNNASTIGTSPMPALADLDETTVERIYAVNVFAPLALTRLLLPDLATSRGVVLNISSDAAVEPYPGWGGYGPSKAALDHMTAILATEQRSVTAYALDPGDMRTRMHQDAEPGEDLSGLPAPATVVPAVLRLLELRPPSGRFRAGDLTETLPAGAR
ncbi:MAG: SDR family NAD(P)-dependent oxidoreductase [Nocardioidaceae bacterium]